MKATYFIAAMLLELCFITSFAQQSNVAEDYSKYIPEVRNVNNFLKTENGFGGNNSMNSFNHYSFGAVASWMYNYWLGIQRHPQKTGFK